MERILQDADGDHKYVLFVPRSYSPQKAQAWPLIVFLHGAYERGTDGKRQLKVGLGPSIRKRAGTFPAFVLFPQAEDDKTPIKQVWSANSPDGRRVLAMIDQVQRDYPIQKERTILTGWSMGGYGAWQLAAAHPDRFSAVVPIAGGADPETARKLKGIPVWAFHGSDDVIVKPDETRRACRALQLAGGVVECTELPGIGHDSWKAVYENESLFEWMFDPSRGFLAPLRVRPGERRDQDSNGPYVFRPALEITNALSVRLGNEALKALAYTIPALVPRSSTSGKLPDIESSAAIAGRPFAVRFADISYTATLERMEMRGTGRDRLLIQLGLRDLSLTLGRTELNGAAANASAGPINVTIGIHRPVWLSIVTAPKLEGRRIQLRLVESYFTIPDDNWSVSPPLNLPTPLPGLTREGASRSFIACVAGQKARFEHAVRTVTPSLLKQLERNLDLSEAKSIAEALWPLPVYRPRMKVWLAGISTDEEGVTIDLGLSVASIDPRKAPRSPRRVALPVAIASETGGTKLSVTVAPELLAPLSTLLIREDLARIHVADVPERAFFPFLDREALAAAVPDAATLPEDAELWAELILVEPLDVHGIDSEDGAGIELGLPRLLISTAYRTPDASDWTPYAEFEFTVRQPTRFHIGKPDFATRTVEFDWKNLPPQVTAAGRFAPNYKPRRSAIDNAALAKLFSKCWHCWTQGQAAHPTVISDVDFRFSRLRVQELESSPAGLTAIFGAPGVRVTNSSDRLLQYQVKGPHSDWSTPYVLHPGGSHDFDVFYPLEYRRLSAAGVERYTLPVGSHSEFRRPANGGPPQLFQAHRK